MARNEATGEEGLGWFTRSTVPGFHWYFPAHRNVPDTASHRKWSSIASSIHWGSMRSSR